MQWLLHTGRAESVFRFGKTVGMFLQRGVVGGQTQAIISKISNSV